MKQMLTLNGVESAAQTARVNRLCLRTVGLLSRWWAIPALATRRQGEGGKFSGTDAASSDSALGGEVSQCATQLRRAALVEDELSMVSFCWGLHRPGDDTGSLVVAVVGSVVLGQGAPKAGNRASGRGRSRRSFFISRRHRSKKIDSRTRRRQKSPHLARRRRKARTGRFGGEKHPLASQTNSC